MFPPSWFECGLATSESAAAFDRYARQDPTKPPRHWRWLAFRDFLEENGPLDAERCRALFQLGESEADENLGTAMMCTVLYQRFCPSDVKQSAANSPRAAIRRSLPLTPRGTTK